MKVILVLFIVAMFGPGARAQSPTNVVLIVADDLGYNDLRSFGSLDALTPNIDRLSQSGVRLTNFYVQPVCSPTRYSLLTSRYVNRSQDLIFSAISPAIVNIGIEESDGPTLGENFQAAGYRSVMIGKWHLGTGRIICCEKTDSPYHPRRHGFDYFYGPLSGVIDYNTHETHGFLDWFENRMPNLDAGYATELFTREAVEFIETRRNRPFFLYLPYTAPHSGLSGDPDPVSRMQLPVGRERESLSRFDDVYPDDRNIRKRYLAMLAVLDDGVGEILDALERTGVSEKTLVIFLSDNGGVYEFGGSNTPLRGEKATLWEGGIRTPAIFRLPGILPTNAVSTQLMHAVDIMPTILSLVGLSPSAVDGVDLAPQLRANTTTARDIFYHDPERGDVYRRNAWKYVRHVADNRDLLFNLETDPGESQDLASTKPGILSQLKTIHLRQKAILPAVPPTLRILKPYFVDTWASGSSHKVTWMSLSLSPESMVRILLRHRTYDPESGKNVWSSWTTLIQETPNTGSWQWHMPATIEPSREYQIMIRSLVDGKINAKSTPFAIVSPEKLAISMASTPSTLPGPAALASYPNPFDRHATIEYTVPTSTHVHMAVYDVVGRKLHVLVDEVVLPGRHGATLDGTQLPAGVYLVRLETGAYTGTMPLILSR